MSIGLILLAVYIAPIANILSIEPPTPQGWALALGMGLLPLVVIQILKLLGVVE